MTISDSYCMCSMNIECHIHSEPHPRDRYVIEQKGNKHEA